MSLKLHNTLGGRVEEFVPIESGKVKMYHCGPTVYDRAHVGNLRSYVFADILRRVLEYGGLEVEQVVNITDIGHLTSDADTGDDKMVKGLKREGLPMTLEGLKTLADKYTEAFERDLQALNIKEPKHLPKATEYLEQEKSLIKKIEENGYAYKLDDGLYFDTGKLENYGALGGLTPLSESQARIDAGGKKSPRDFVLWKFSNDEHMGFPSSWVTPGNPRGVGYPGWHIECSAMSRELLGQPFDIHTGGIDHIPVHHNNEIAQSEAAFGTKLANFWLHNEFVRMNDAKMAKSLGTGVTLDDLSISPIAYRYFLLMAHYRSPVNLTEEALQAAENALRKLNKVLGEMSDGGVVSESYKAQFTAKIENDLNTPQALALLWTMLKDKELSPADKRATALDFDLVLGLGL